MMQIYRINYRCKDGFSAELIAGSVEGAHECIRTLGIIDRIISLSIVGEQYLPLMGEDNMAQLYVNNNYVEFYTELDFLEGRISWLN